MYRSIACCDHASCFDFGGCESFTGLNAQKARARSAMVFGAAARSAGVVGQGAPSVIHFSSDAISFALSFAAGSGGISKLSCFTAAIRRLFSGRPTVIAGPSSPPLSIAARESRRRPLCSFFAP